VAGKSIKAGSAYVEIGIRSRISAGAKQVSADLKKLGGKISGVGRSLAMLATAAAAPLAGMTLSFAAAGDNLDKMSKRTGVGVKALSELAFAAEQSGASLDSVEKGIRGMQRSLLNAEMGSKTATDALSALGLSVDELSGMSPEDQFTKIADAIGDVEDPSKRAALAMQLFGRAGSELLPMMSENAEGIANLRKEANELGRTMTAEDAQAAAELTDAMNRVKSVLIGVKNQIGAALAPAMTYLADLVARTSKAVVPLIRENAHLVKLFAAGAIAVGGLGAALMTVGGLLIGAGMAVGVLATAFSVLFSPLEYFGLGGEAVDAFKRKFGPLVTDVQNAMLSIKEALIAGDVEKAWEIISETMELLWLDMTDEIREAWLDMLGFILNTGSSIAEAIGQIFQGLATVLETMMSYYKSIYDTIYQGVLDLGGDLTGVRTIGATSSGFEANLGGVSNAAQSGIDSLREFGIAMESEAQGRRDQRDEQRAADRAARDERLKQLRINLQAEFRAAKEADDQRKKRKDGSGDDTKVTVTGIAPDRAGPTGTFSAFGAALIGAAPVEQKVSDPKLLKAQEKGNELLNKVLGKMKKGVAETPLTLPSVLASYTGGPVYTNNGCTVREIASREGSDSAGGSTASITWRVSGSADPAAGRTALLNLGLSPLVVGGPIDNIYDGLGMSSLSRERVADEVWDFTAEYKQREPEPGEYTVSIDTSGGQIMQTYAYAESKYVATGESAPGMNNAIDVQDNKPQGVQRVIPALKITVRAKIKTSNITTVGGVMAYAQAISELTGTVNNATAFGQFAAGELLFTGASGDIIAEDPSLQFNFLASKNVTGLTIGSITGIAKNGHDYIWFSFKSDKDATTGLQQSKPRAAYVNRIYGEADHSLLYIGV